LWGIDFIGLHTFYKQKTAITKDITRDNHGATVREVQPGRSLFAAPLTDRPGNAKIIYVVPPLYNCYTLQCFQPGTKVNWRTKIDRRRR
jgi:hypothetical protein